MKLTESESIMCKFDPKLKGETETGKDKTEFIEIGTKDQEMSLNVRLLRHQENRQTIVKTWITTYLISKIPLCVRISQHFRVVMSIEINVKVSKTIVCHFLPLSLTFLRIRLMK